MAKVAPNDILSSSSVLQFVRPAAGGMRWHVLQLSARLLDRGLRVGIAAPESFTGPADVGVPMVRVPIPARTRLIADWRAAAALRRAARGYSLIHAHGMRAGYVAALACRRGNPPIVLTLHNVTPPGTSGLARAAIRFATQRASAVIAISVAVADGLAELGMAREAITLVPNGIDLECFEHAGDTRCTRTWLGVEDGQELVLAVGRLSREKGFDVLVEAAALVLDERPGTRFVLVGEGPDEMLLREAVARHDLGDRFMLVGGRDDVPALLHASDLVVVPSRTEGQSLVALEAMAAGRAVVASSVGGLCETVLNERTGLLVRPGAPADLAKATIELLGDPNRRDELGTHGRERVERFYRLETMVDRVMAEYRRALLLRDRL